jgi:DNA-binding response OmpR family regulator
MATAKILVVDDDHGVRFFLEDMLTRDGHEVVAVESGEAALEHVATHEFDLALVDLKLKGIGGLEVLKALHQQSPDTAVIVLTAHATLETAVEALRQGAHDYLFKPCKAVDLRESVRTGLLKHQWTQRQHELLTQLTQHLAVEKSAAAAHPTRRGVERPTDLLFAAAEPTENQARFLQRGGLIVDLMRHVTTLDGQMLELSPTEFALVAYLVSEAPRVVPPQELVRAVQGYECEPWEARETLRYHVHRIRQKVRQATERADIIQTVRGVGYTMAC